MTIIVFREGVLAADTQLTGSAGFITQSMMKIGRGTDGCIGGGAGDGTNVQLFLNWISEPREAEWAVEGSFCGMLVMPNSSVWLYEDTDLIKLRKQPFYAVGAGAPIAMGAMEQGATAREAVKIAMKYSTSCGGQITTLDLHPKKKAKAKVSG